METRLIESFDSYAAVGGVLGVEGRWIISSLTGMTLPAGRFGGQALRGSGGLVTTAIAGAALVQGSAGLAVQPISASGTGRVFTLETSSGAVQITLAIDSLGRVLAYKGNVSGGTFLAASTALLTFNVWYYLEVEFRVDNPAGYVRVFANGSPIITFTGDTLAVTGEPSASRIGILGSSSVVCAIDDIYVSEKTTRYGEARVQTIRPIADTADKDFVPNSGSTNYSRVNELLIDGDTTYVSSSTVGAEDLYDLDNLDATPENIFAVQVRVVARKDDAATRAIKAGLKSGATLTLGEEFFLSSSYTTHVDIYDLNPDTSAAWNKAAVDAIQIGQRITI